MSVGVAVIENAELAMKRAGEAFERFDVEDVITHLSEAIRGFTAAGEPCHAAIACVPLGEVLASPDER